ncbi:MAG: T9SS type A sorting domain-containing protein [Saprospiraceae bacterium]|nr:T9SS type A sorting domain-containing protein [Saprospiraceae bacterium]
MQFNPLKTLAGALFLFPLLLSYLPIQQAEAEIIAFHSQAELESFSLLFPDTLLPNQYNALFAASGTCDKCHGYDTAMVASIDPSGQDINVVDDWRATMMANSAKDPFWRAKVSHEVLVNPLHQQELEDKCTSCHAPLGHFNALHIGADHYTMADLAMDTVGLDGVSCLACHQQKPEGLGNAHSGNLNFDTAKIAYGPFPGPLVSPMALETGWVPVYGPHIQEAGVCAACHTLITATVDLNGNSTGGTFVEQATYHEWLNSDYGVQEISCQSCHMPQFTKGDVFLVAGIDTEGRSPFGQHTLVGANSLMLEVLRDNAAILGVNALPEHFEETIGKTLNLLQNQSLQLEIAYPSFDLPEDSIDFKVTLRNLAGHKFPSGYPARRLSVQFLVIESGDNPDTLFASGLFDENFEVYGQNSAYEPHYQIIRSEEEVQLYELVMGDVNGDVTTVLERADHPIKDNRLSPKGFTTNHPVYDTTRIAGQALLDPDFNIDEFGAEGSGADILTYRLASWNFTQDTRVLVRVFYQSAPPKWMLEMFSESSPEIDAFKSMFDNADRTPVLVQESEMLLPGFVSSAEKAQTDQFVQIAPNPASDQLTIQAIENYQLDIYSLDGKKQDQIRGQSGEQILDLQLGPGIYIFQFQFKSGRSTTKRVVIQ